MEGFFLLLGLGLLCIPILAIAAFVRAGAVRRDMEQRYQEQRDAILDLEGEVASLKRVIADVKGRLATEGAATKVEAPVTEAAHTSPAPTTVAIPAPKPAAEVAEPATIASPQRTVAASAPAVPQSTEVTTPPPRTSVPTTHQMPWAAASTTAKNAAPPAVTNARPEPTSPSSGAHSSEQPRPAYPPRIAMPETPPRQSLRSWLSQKLPLEEVLGMNLFAKIGIVLLVLGFTLLGRVAMTAMGPAGKVTLLYAATGLLLGGGIWLERKERYRLIGRTGIGGGWALAFFTTYAMNHVTAMHIMASQTVNCVLLLAIALAIVMHTLRYNSQLVTGLAFLLGFSTVALTQDTVYALSAGVVLALGIVAVALRMGWYELEVFGILASFGNHFYWLYRLYPGGVAGHAFPQFWPSTIILLLYWLVFRVSYVARRISRSRDESTSTVAALVNTVLLLAVMKFQSTRPELAFYALAVLGALEFAFGQLPVTRRRRAAFTLLTIMGTLLMFAAVPFKYSGNSIALLWMIAAEVLIAAGIAQSEVVFRRLGLIAGIATGLLVGFEARGLVELRTHSEDPQIASGVQLLLCAVLFYANAHFVRTKWRSLFEGFDGTLATIESYLGAAMAFLGVWAVFPGDWTAIGWAVLLLAAAAGMRLLDEKHFLAQAWIFGAAAVIRSTMMNCHLDTRYPHHVALRLITLPLLTAIFYATGWLVTNGEQLRTILRSYSLLAGTAMLAALAWLELMPAWVALAWLALAVALCVAAHLLRVEDLYWQEHALAAMVALRLIVLNLSAASSMERYLPILASAVVFYAISRWCTAADANYKPVAAWAHTWAATGLLAALAWHEAPQPWLAVVWVSMALALAVVDRFLKLKEFPLQAHALALMSIGQAAMFNLFLADKWRGIDLRLVTLALVLAALYGFTYMIRMREEARKAGLNHLYSWAATAIAGWLLWSDLSAIAVADGLAIFGLALFECGEWRKERALRLQGYALIAVAFARIFVVNLTAATLPGEALSPRIYTVVPIALIDFYVWARLQSREGAADRAKEQGWIGNLMGWMGTAAIGALLYFQITPEWIVVAWAAMAVVLLLAALILDKELFLQQAVLMIAAVVTRGIVHNIFGGSYFTAEGWRGNFAVPAAASALLLASLPIAFRIKSRYADRPLQLRISRMLGLHRMEQWVFFAPVALATLVIAVKMNPGMITLSWGIEGVAAVLLGLSVTQRSYRITGLLLLMICVCKIVFRDAWQLTERDRYITLIALGAALMLVSTLYNRFREQVRRLL